MSVSSDIRDHAYQFFIEEVPELLNLIESGLLSLKQERTKAKVHEIMRAAHSIKGGSASVGLDTIKTIAHRLEDIFKALYNDEVAIDNQLENLLLEGYDCLKNPLLDQLETGNFDAEKALAKANPIFEQIEAKLGDALKGADDYLPSSEDLGIDIVASIFEVDVAEGLERLESIIANPSNHEIAGELTAQAEVFSGFAELLNLPGFAEIGNTANKALELHPDQGLEILKLAVKDWTKGREQVLQGDRVSGGSPSPQLLALASENQVISKPVQHQEIDTDIRDHAYQFFIEEVPELLNLIESGLLSLKQERTKAKVHEIMRAAHSIKGGSASVGLDTIKTIAHRLEDIFKALYNDEVAIDNQLENLLLEGYDCLKNPLLDQLETGSFDPEKALAKANPIFEQIEAKLGDALKNADDYLPSSEDLGIDIVASLFEVDVAEGLERLTKVVENPNNYEIKGELIAQAEVFAGFAELLNLPGFAEIGNTATKALELHPDQALEILKLAVKDWTKGREQVLQGDRVSGGNPSPQLLALAGQQDQGEILSLDDLFAEAIITDENSANLIDFEIETNQEIISEDPVLSLDLMFEDMDLPDQPGNLFETTEELNFDIDLSQPIPDLDDIFADAIQEEQPTTNGKQAPSLDQVLQKINQNLETLPTVEETSLKPPVIKKSKIISKTPTKVETPKKQQEAKASPQNLSVRVDLNRLERMNDLVGELAINRNSLSLQNEQLQTKVKELLNRFVNFQKVAVGLRELSDQAVVDRSSFREDSIKISPNIDKIETSISDFDALEMDSYSKMHYLLQEILEGMVQLEETVDDITLFAKQANQSIDGQRQMLNHLRDELMWARMLPLGEVLRRFPRVLRDLSNTYNKPVELSLSGTGVLVDKAVLEKLYDPLLHLLRNAFDHGIETPEERRKKGKPETGTIEIRAYHKGSQTVIEMKDDGKGINRDKIKERAIELGWLRPEQLADVDEDMILDLLFKPGFSTADQVSELSGRGVGLDVVRSQLRSLKGSVSINSSPGKGTSFILQLPLTLTIAKLLVCLIGGSTAIALPADSVEEIFVPKEIHIKRVGSQRFLYWREQAVPIYRLGNLLEYNCPLPETLPSKVLTGVPTPEDWMLPLLIIRKDDQLFALEVERLVTEQELVIKPFGAAITPPNYIYGCTILGDGSIIPVIEATTLLEKTLGVATAPININTDTSHSTNSLDQLSKVSQTVSIPKVLVVDDSAALRRTLAFTLQKAGYRVLQARDGKEALEQLQKSSQVALVICDIEMPNMNGFEFLGQKRREPNLKTIPVAMLTSRSNDKHRRLAMQLGATAYFSKPYIEQEFLIAIKDIIGQNANELATVNS